MKRNKLVFVGLLVAVTFIASVTMASAAPIVIKFSHVVAENTPERTNGEQIQTTD